jgi:hypothetical protein
MAEPDYSAASWAHTTTASVTQGSGLTAPPLSEHGPFEQQIPSLYGHPHMSNSNASLPHVQSIPSMGMSHQLHGRSPYPPIGSRQQHYHHHMHSYQFPGPPRPPPILWSETDSLHANMGFYGIGDRMQGHQPFIPPRTISYGHQAPGQSNAGAPQYDSRRYNHRMSVSSIAQDSPAQGVRFSHEGNQNPPPAFSRSPRHEHQQSTNPTPDFQGQRPWMPTEVQGRRSDRSNATRTSNNRRSFARYSVDLSHSSTSSDAEEAAARAPPVSRMRHRPREVPGRPRFAAHRPHFDANIATPRQIQELKDSLQRRLPSELPKDASSACDICQKDYSTTHAAPTEEQEIAIVLSCGHSFGEFCIFQWVSIRTVRRVEPRANPPSVRHLQNSQEQGYMSDVSDTAD